MKINKDLIMKKSEEIKEALRFLNQLNGIPLSEFLNNKDKISACKYEIIRAFEAAFSICNHLCAKILAKSPDTYSECFNLLTEHQIIDKELAHRLSAFAKFRNLLIHLYWKVDDAEVYKNIIAGLEDLEQYTNSINQYIKNV